MSFQTYIQNWTSGLCPPICDSYSFIHVGKWQNPAICSGQKLWCPPGYHTCSVRQSCSFCFQSTNDFSPFHCYHVGLSHHHLQLRLFQWSPLQSISPIMASPSLQNTLNKRATITCYIRSFCSFSQNHPMPFIFPPLSQWPLSCHSTYALTFHFIAPSSLLGLYSDAIFSLQTSITNLTETTPTFLFLCFLTMFSSIGFNHHLIHNIFALFCLNSCTAARI